MRCFYCETLSEGKIVLSRSEEKHIFSVNKIREGEEVFFIDGNGRKARARTLKSDCFELLDISVEPQPSIKLHLFVAPPRRQQMDQIIEQASEVGIWSINPIITERSVAAPQKVHENERWKLKLIESCKQSLNPYIPQISIIRSFKNAVSLAREMKCNSFFGSIDASGKIASFQESPDIAWFVGPEGGFSPAETDAMRKNNFTALRLGRSVMRVETAAIVGAAYLLNISELNFIE